MLKQHLAAGSTIKYVQVTLSQNNVQHVMYVHRLVLETFVGECPDGEEGRHHDNNTSNNALGNLSWSTHKENLADRERFGTVPRGESAPWSKLSKEKVLAIRASTKLHRELADEYGVSRANITYIKNRKTWGHM